MILGLHVSYWRLETMVIIRASLLLSKIQRLSRALHVTLTRLRPNAIGFRRQQIVPGQLGSIAAMHVYVTLTSFIAEPLPAVHPSAL
jgi:hypothetical protein